MQVNKFVTMAVGLVVGVLLISGVVAPVIANVSGNSDDSGTSTASYKEYTNTGEVYLSEPDGVSHEITVTYTGSKMVFAFDGTNFLEKPLGTEDWEVPIAQYKVTHSPYYPQYRILSLQWSAHMERLIFNGDTFSLNEIIGEDGICLSISTNYNNNRDVISITKYWSGGTESYTVTMYIAQEGGYVYAKSPTVYANTTVSVSSLKYAVATISGMTGNLYAEVGGWAKLSKWQGALDETFPYAYCEMEFSAEVGSSYYDYYLDSFTVTVHTHDSEGAYVLDDVTFNVSMSGVNGEISYDYVVDMFIVPAVEKYVPQNGLWSMAGNDEFDILSAYLGNNLYSVAIGNPDDGGKVIYTGSISEGSFVLPIMIGETFFVVIEWNAENPMEDWHAEMFVYGIGDPESGGDYTLSLTNEIHVDGKTISFEDISTGSAVERSADGLIAYIYDEGEYTSFTEPTNAELSYIGFLGGYDYSSYDYVAGDMADVNINTIGVMSGTDLSYISGMFRGSISVDGGDDNWDDVEYALTTSNTSCQINKSDDMFTGLTVSTQDKSVSFPVGSSYDFTDTDDLFEVLSGSVFGIGKIGSEGGSGGGSGLSPTLTTVLSVIPLVLTVGLVLGAVTYLRMKN